MCHRSEGQGADVGPKLETVRNRTPSQLLIAILDPNREVSPNYVQYNILAEDGLITTGIIESETPSMITLRRQDGETHSVLRADIEQMKSSGMSLMPEGVEQKITKEEMSDLIAYLLRED